MTSVRAKEEIREMLAEDIGFGDVTTEALVPAGAMAEAVIIAKSRGILAGVNEAAFAFDEFGVAAKALKDDGEPVEAGDVVMRLKGQARGILAAERVALNLLMRMSGVATATREMLERAREVNPRILLAATRKTMPRFSYFDKRSVRLGGGDPHRFRLDDCVLIKENHLKLFGSITQAAHRARKISFSKKVEVEVNNPQDALEAARAGADIVMFDNLTPAKIRRGIELLEKCGLRKKVLIEASGEINPSNIFDYAAIGVDIISSSYMTLRAPALDMSLEIQGKGFKFAAGKKKRRKLG